MISSLVFAGVIVLVTLGLFFVVTVYAVDDDPILLGSPRVKYLVIAETYQQALTLMVGPTDDWRYIQNAADLLGYKAGEVQFMLIGRWANSPIFKDSMAFQRLRSLGLTAYPEYDQTL